MLKQRAMLLTSVKRKSIEERSKWNYILHRLNKEPLLSAAPFWKLHIRKSITAVRECTWGLDVKASCGLFVLCSHLGKAPIQTLQTHCLNWLFLPPSLCSWESMRTEHVVPFLDISVVLYLYGRCCHSFQAALPPSDLGAEAAWLPFKSLSQALGQLTLWKSENGQQVGDVLCGDVKVPALRHCTWAVSSAHLWLWCGYFAALFKSSLVSPFQAPAFLQCSSSPSLCDNPIYLHFLNMTWVGAISSSTHFMS